MCTMGSAVLEDGTRVLFKNKDFALPDFSDRVVSDPHLFGPAGLETFAEDEAQTPVFSGLSIGANQHGLLATVNHVKITDPDHRNYDRLTEIALREGVDVSSGISAIRAAVAEHPYWWGNLILADDRTCAAVEVRGQEVNVETAEGSIFRTNHQPLFGETESPDDLPCSVRRHVSAGARLDGIRTVEELTAMLSSHDDGETGICNHGVPLTTVYSYVLSLKDGQTTAHIANGLPCQAGWAVLAPPLGEAWTQEGAAELLDAYPNAVAHS